MAQLTYDQVKQLWIDAGGNPAWAPVAAGLAYGESGWRTDAVNPNSPDYGLWQLTYAGNLNERRRAMYGAPEQLLQNPAAQAQAVVKEYGPNLEFVRIGFGGGGDMSKADVFYQVWSAKTGGTLTPANDADTLNWIGHILSDPRGGGAGGTLPNATGDAIAGGAVEGATTAADSTKHGCSVNPGGFSVLGSGKIGTRCQIKALAGGLIVGVGVTLVVTGAVLVAMQTGVGKSAANSVTGLVPGGGLIKSLGGSSSRFPRVTAETEQESRANYDARNPSPERQQATRRARSGNLGVSSFTMDDLADMF